MEKLFRTNIVYLVLKDFTHLETTQPNAKNVWKILFAQAKISLRSYLDTGERPKKLKKYSPVSFFLNHV